MRGIIVAGVLSLFSVSALAAPPTCRDTGAARTSFTKKCLSDTVGEQQ
jgi:hypothetical protein